MTPIATTTRLIQDMVVAADVLVVLAVTAGLVWVVLECRKIRLLRREDEHQTEQVKEELLKAQDELFSPNNSYEDDEERYKSTVCAICHRPLGTTSTTTTCSIGTTTTEQPLSEHSPLMESKKNTQHILLSLRCGHEFHKDCITNWMAAERHNCDPCRCPVCLQAL